MSEPSRQMFYRGFLLALRAQCDSFESHGDRFHETFEETLGTAALAERMPFPDLIAELLEDKDPMFGTYRGAEEMVLEGLYALLLSLEAPRYVQARFNISKGRAMEELGAMEHAAVYATMAKTFHEYWPHGYRYQP